MKYEIKSRWTEDEGGKSMTTRLFRELECAWNHQAKALNYAALGFISGVQWVLQMLCSGLDLLHAFFTHQPNQRVEDIIRNRPYYEGEI